MAATLNRTVSELCAATSAATSAAVSEGISIDSFAGSRGREERPEKQSNDNEVV
jgi:hypothetical protein